MVQVAGSNSDAAPRRRALRIVWRGVGASIAVTLIIVAATTSSTASKLGSRFSDLEARLRAGDANMVLLNQQLDQVFQAELLQWESGASLTESDLESIQVWLTFDTAFTARNRNDLSLTFERAVAHERAGQCALLLGRPKQSIDHTLEARRLYKELVSSHPTAWEYVADVAAVEVLLGEALWESGDASAAVQTYQEAIALIGTAEVSRTEEGDRLLAEWQERLEALMALSEE